MVDKGVGVVVVGGREDVGVSGGNRGSRILALGDVTVGCGKMAISIVNW